MHRPDAPPKLTPRARGAAPRTCHTLTLCLTVSHTSRRRAAGTASRRGEITEILTIPDTHIAWTEAWPTQPARHRPLIGKRSCGGGRSATNLLVPTKAPRWEGDSWSHTLLVMLCGGDGASSSGCPEYALCRLVPGCILEEKHSGICIFPFVERGGRSRKPVPVIEACNAKQHLTRSPAPKATATEDED